MTKLDDCWDSHKKSFEKVSRAVSDLLDDLIECAVARGVNRQVAVDTYVDWVRTHMKEESFMS